MLQLDTSYTKTTGTIAISLPSQLRSPDYVVRVVTPGGHNYDYFMKGGESCLAPLVEGSGEYWVMLYERVGSSAKRLESAPHVFQLVREDAAFLSPNTYVPFDERIITFGNKIVEGHTNILETVRAYVAKHFHYDYVRANVLAHAKNQLPDPYHCLKAKSGVCQDLAALATGVLRAQGIPTQLVIGWANGQYHAWVQPLGGELWDVTADVQKKKPAATYKVERVY